MSGMKDVATAVNGMPEKTFAIVVKPKDDEVKMSSQEVKEKII